MLYDLTYYDSSLSYSAVPFAWSLTGETRALLRWRMIALAPLNPSFIVCPPHLRFAICTVVHNVSWFFFLVRDAMSTIMQIDGWVSRTLIDGDDGDDDDDNSQLLPRDVSLLCHA